MVKNVALSLICTLALALGLGGAKAQMPAFPGQQPVVAPSMSPDDPHLILMTRNVIVALNQANMTGNYSVLRDMGTPNFQITNSSARLAEAFSALRSRKLDISPVMFFNPKFTAPPAVQDGQVMRLTGFFPTTPEQVSFDIAFQLFGEQWMLAGIAVNVAPPGENAQAFAAPAPQSRVAEKTESKPIQIDMALPSPTPQPARPAPKRPAAKKPKPAAQQTAAAQPPVVAPPAPAASEPPAQQPVQAEAQSADRSGPSWGPFGR